MTYQVTLVEGQFSNDTIRTSFPATFSNVLLNVWFELKPDFSGLQFGASNHSFATNAYSGFKLTIDAFDHLHPLDGLIQIQFGNNQNYDRDLYEQFGYITWDSSELRPNVVYNLLVSCDTVTQVVQCYINDVPLAQIPDSPFWLDNTPMTTPDQFGGTSSVTTYLLAQNNFTGTNPCVGDAFMRVSNTFFDLSIEANRRKFINSDLTPVYLGANGEIPFGSSPIVFQTTPTPDMGGTAGHFLINEGSAGGSFSPGIDPLDICGEYPASSDVNVDLIGVQATAQVGELIIFHNNFTIKELDLIQPMVTDGNRKVSLRYSDDGGANWSNPINQTIGNIGEYETDVQWRRLGYARSRVIELSWSNEFTTALTGVFVLVEISGT